MSNEPWETTHGKRNVSKQVLAPKENAFPKALTNLQTKNAEVGPSFLVFNHITQNGEDKTPQGKSKIKCEATMMNRSQTKWSKDEWNFFCNSHHKVVKIREYKWGQSRPKWKTLKGPPVTPKASYRGRRRGKKGSQNKKNHHKQNHERLLMPLMTWHTMSWKKAPHPEQGTSEQAPTLAAKERSEPGNWP